MHLKAVIFSIADVVLPTTSNPQSQQLKSRIDVELRKLFAFLLSKNIEVLFLTIVMLGLIMGTLHLMIILSKNSQTQSIIAVSLTMKYLQNKQEEPPISS